VQGRSTPVASRLRLVSPSVPNERSEASPRKELVRLVGVLGRWPGRGRLVSSGGSTLGRCVHESRTTPSWRVFPVDSDQRTGRGRLDLSGEVFRAVRTR
jgi:hypothetical protein